MCLWVNLIELSVYYCVNLEPQIVNGVWAFLTGRQDDCLVASVATEAEAVAIKIKIQIIYYNNDFKELITNCFRNTIMSWNDNGHRWIHLTKVQ